jgi:hypothetical protein
VEYLPVLSLQFLFGCLQYPEIFVPLRETLLLETARGHSEPNEVNRLGGTFQ